MKKNITITKIILSGSCLCRMLPTDDRQSSPPVLAQRVLLQITRLPKRDNFPVIVKSANGAGKSASAIVFKVKYILIPETEGEKIRDGYFVAVSCFTNFGNLQETHSVAKLIQRDA